MTLKKTEITDYEIVDHGVEGSQYFQGCGVALTDYEFVATGNGDNFAEAIDEALEYMSQGEECSGVDFKGLEARMLADEGLTEWPTEPSAMAVARKANGVMSDEEWEELMGECDTYYYVSVRYNVGE